MREEEKQGEGGRGPKGGWREDQAEVQEHRDKGKGKLPLGNFS